MSTNETKHTPGPWAVVGGATPKYKAINSTRGYIVFEMADQFQHVENGRSITAPDYDTQDANAALIAAAPDMFEALERLERFAHQLASGEHIEERTAPLLETARAALSKAKGN